MTVLLTRVFISYITTNISFVDPLVERLWDNYIKTLYGPRNMLGGYFAENIHQAISECDWFIVVLSKAALESKWVKMELNLAMADSRFYNRIILIIAELCNWKTIHENLGRYQIFDFTQYPKEATCEIAIELAKTFCIPVNS